MNFHSLCKCELRDMTGFSSIKRYDIMSEDEYVGCFTFCPLLGEWVLFLASHNTGITFEFLAKIWSNLMEELTTAKS